MLRTSTECLNLIKVICIFFSFILEGRLFSIYGLWVWLLFVGKMYRKLVCIYRCSKNYLQNNRKVCVGIIIDK